MFKIWALSRYTLLDQQVPFQPPCCSPQPSCVDNYHACLPSNSARIHFIDGHTITVLHTNRARHAIIYSTLHASTPHPRNPPPRRIPPKKIAYTKNRLINSCKSLDHYRQCSYQRLSSKARLLENFWDKRSEKIRTEEAVGRCRKVE